MIATESGKLVAPKLIDHLSTHGSNLGRFLLNWPRYELSMVSLSRTKQEESLNATIHVIGSNGLKKDLVSLASFRILGQKVLFPSEGRLIMAKDHSKKKSINIL